MIRVAIIGGGIGGLTAAKALSRAGIEVAVYEAAAELKEIGAGVALHPNAMKVLRAIGVEEDVRKVAGRSQWQFMRNWKTGRVIGRTGRQQQVASFGIAGATVHRADLLECSPTRCRPTSSPWASDARRCGPAVTSRSRALRTAARSRPMSSLALTVSIPRYAPRCSARTPPGSPGRFAIAASFRPEPSAAPGPPPSFGQWLGPHGTIVLYPLRGEDLINVVCHHDDDDYRHESWIAECSREEVLKRYAGWHESLLRLFAAADTWYKWALTTATRFRSGRAAGSPSWGRCASDAPLPGTGRLPGDRGRAVLAAALSAETSHPLTGLARYERTRRPRASRVVLASRERGLSNHLTSRWAVWRRDL